MASYITRLLNAPTTYHLGLPPASPVPCLEGEARADVAVIGAGYAGMNAALELARRGLKTVLLEAGTSGCGASGRNGGQIIPGFNLSQRNLRDIYGTETMHALWLAIEQTRRSLIERLHTVPDRCGFRKGVIYAALTPAQMAGARAQQDDLAHWHGYTGLRIIEREEIRETVSPVFVGGIEWHDSGHINPYKYALLLRQLVLASEVRLYENSAVTSLEKAAGGYRLATAKGTVTAEKVVLCGGAGFIMPKGALMRGVPRMHVPIATFILATEPCDAAGILPSEAAISDLRNAMSYFRRMPDNRILYGGDVDIPMIGTRKALQTLEREMRRVLPRLGSVKVESCWAGQIDTTDTLLPSIRETAPGLYQADGFSGHGLVLTALAGESIAREICASSQGEHDPVFGLLASLCPAKLPGNKALAMLVQAWHWLPKFLEDRRSL